ncbi:MAG: hypothetical protein LBS62_11095 [Clostridiales bacterium]|jgi:hypothetical protein|nr:hypothetical protein [Clostridiales bacterium]
MLPVYYKQLSAKEIAQALDINDCAEISGERIVNCMLSGQPSFTRQELKTVAKRSGVSLEELFISDNRFAGYQRKFRGSA